MKKKVANHCLTCNKASCPFFLDDPAVRQNECFVLRYSNDTHIDNLKREYEPYRLLLKSKVPLSGRDAEFAHSLQNELVYELESTKRDGQYLAMLYLEICSLRLQQFRKEQKGDFDDSVQELEFERYDITFFHHNN